MFAPIAALVVAASAPAAQADTSLPRMRAFATELVDTLRARGVAAPTGLFYVSVDAGGGNAELNVMGGNVPGSLRAALMPAAAAFINERGVAEPLFLTVLLDRVETGHEVLPIGSENRPAVRNPGRIREYMHRVLEAHPELRRGWHTAELDILVNRRGRVAVVYLRSRTGEADINQYLPALAAELEFTPATIAGQPVHAWVRQTFSFGMDP